MYVIIVDFLIKENEVEKFKPLMLENARASLMDEPGCRQFDVCFDLDNTRKCFLYEVYDDKSAFDAHLATEHFGRLADNSILPTVVGLGVGRGEEMRWYALRYGRR